MSEQYIKEVEAFAGRTLTDEEKQQAAVEEWRARQRIRLQTEEAEKAKLEQKWKNVGEMTDKEFKAFTSEFLK
jgi:hypothetical protein